MNKLYIWLVHWTLNFQIEILMTNLHFKTKNVKNNKSVGREFITFPLKSNMNIQSAIFYFSNETEKNQTNRKITSLSRFSKNCSDRLMCLR